MKRRAIITGIGGQAGSYLAELLLVKDYEVHGFVRREAIESPREKLWRLKPVLSRIVLHAVSLDNPAGIYRVLAGVKPDEVYHLAARSFVSRSFEDEITTFGSNVNRTLYVLSAIREAVPRCRFYFAGSSEMFGNAPESPQNESTPFNPRTPYGISKLAGLHITRAYRESHGIFACAGILYNHESPRRGLEFVTRKITHAVARIAAGTQHELKLGNVTAVRYWGYCADYAWAMWLMLQQERPDDYVIATGITHTVAEFAEAAFGEVGLDWRDFVSVDSRFYRRPESSPLTGDYAKARRQLGWRPRVTFEELVSMMVREDVTETRKASLQNPGSLAHDQAADGEGLSKAVR
jgi:GDPmannose 4,6-dehydratase